MMNGLTLTLPRIGALRPRSVTEIAGSNWTLGCEVLDRDFADYQQYKEYIAPLGIKTIRLQGGWAKCEKVPGVYDFAWLDTVIDDAKSRGLNILLETDYGNPIYPGGGGFDLAGGFPTSEEALAAWDRWVEAMARHFRGRVRDWAMWNEPDINPHHTPEDIARFNIRTAAIIRRIIPDARIAGLSLASTAPQLFDRCLKVLADEGALDWFEWFIYHCYTRNPDLGYARTELLDDILKKYGARAKLRQGESGCPSETTHRFALSGYPWTELSQCKWNLRRYLGDLGHGYESAVFTICDFNHIGREINRKGLLRADETHRVLGPKPAYFAVQHMVAIFDNQLETLCGAAAALIGEKSYCYACRRYDGTGGLVVAWNCSEIPSESTDPQSGTIVVRGVPFREPVYCELISGAVYALPDGAFRQMDDLAIFHNVPLWDSPVVIAEKAILPLA